MARRYMNEDLIHCNICGEDYSSTYRRCPFCGERLDVRPLEDPAPAVEDDEYVFDGQDLFDEPDTVHTAPNKGGKRLAPSGSRVSSRGGARSGGSRSSSNVPVGGTRLITFVVALVIIIGALILLFTVIYPMMHDNPAPSPSDPGVSESITPSVQNPLASLNMASPSDFEFTLEPGESYAPTPVFDPVDWDGTLTWVSSDENYAAVSEDGLITNVNQTNSVHRVTITVSGGGQSVELVVFCNGLEEVSPSPDVTDEPEPSPSPSPSPSPNVGDGKFEPNTSARIVNAGGGLNVRSGPGTTYERIASLVNGNEITVLEYAGDDWYKISFYGTNGITTGYIMGDYISAN